MIPDHPEPLEPSGRTRRRAALFLDRDGTLVEDRGDPGDPVEAVFLPGVVDALRELQARFVLIVVTHQAGCAAGRLTLEQVDAVNRSVVERLAAAGVHIEAVYVRPHGHADESGSIKPLHRFLRAAERDHGIDLARSYSIGDHPHDAELAPAAGGTGIYVLTGHGLEHRGELGGGHVVVPALPDALAELRAAGATPAGPVDRAAATIRRGGVVAFPTETVYGLGANALDPHAVARVFEVKRRPFFDPLIVHVAEPAWLDRLARAVSPRAALLARELWPGPLTLVLPKTALVPDLVTAGLDTVAVRMPAHPMALDLLARAGVPVCAPSANLFGSVSPTTAEHVREQLGAAVDALLDGGPCPVGVESTIVDVTGERPRVLRHGGIPVERVAAVLGEAVDEAATPGDPVTAPGMLPRHYAPVVRLLLFEGEIPPPPGDRSGLLLQRGRPAPTGYRTVEALSRDGDLAEAAANLFAALRRLDGSSLDTVVAELAPQRGLGRAVNDRLRRASHREG